MFCTACAAFTPAPAPRCEACGRATGGAAARGARRQGNPPPSRRHRLLRLLYLVPIVALVGGGGVGAERYRAGQAELARWSERGLTASAAGAYPEAIEAFTAADGYRDADARHAAATEALAPYHVAYLDGLAALDAGRFDDAIASLLPVARDLPGYHDASGSLATARLGRLASLHREADGSEASRDWRTAERALALLAAADPDDAVIATRLAALQRAHAPILFTRDHALYLSGPDLSDEQLVSDDLPAAWPIWSPDRTKIAFISHDTADPTASTALYVVDVDGGNLARLADEVNDYPIPSWSPDGARIAYTTVADWNGARKRGSIGVRVVDLATRVTTDPTGGRFSIAMNPVWSPLGDRLAFVTKTRDLGAGVMESAGEVYMATLATGELTNLSQDRLPEAWTVAWSPGDERVLVYSFRPQTWYEPAHTGLAELHARTGELSTITHGEQPVSAPVWSPDGSRYAFVEGTSVVHVRSHGLGEIWINVANPISTFVTWSPDGSALLAAARDPAQSSTLIPLDDGPGDQVLVPLHYDTDYPSMGPPQWSPLHPLSPPGAPAIDGTARDPSAAERSPVAGRDE